MVRRILFILLYVLAPLPAIILIYTSNPTYYGGNALVPMLLGTIAFTWLNFQFILSARCRFIERLFPLGKLYIFHGLMAIVSITLALTHKLLKERVFSESLKTQIGTTSLIIFISVSFLALFFMVGIWAQFSPQIAQLRRKLQTGIGNYQLQKWLHNFSMVATVLLLIHVLLGSAARSPWVMVAYIGYFALALGFYLYHKVIRPYFLAPAFRVEKVIPENRKVTTLVLLPENKDYRLDFLPGQLGFIRLKSSAVSSERHPFSFSSAPEGDNLSLTIKALGDWTSSIRAVKPQDRAWIEGPYGDFSPWLLPKASLWVLLAGGVGITPMLSILRHLAAMKSDQPVILFWTVRNLADFFALEEIINWKTTCPNFDFIPIAQETDDEALSDFLPSIVFDHLSIDLIESHLDKKGHQILGAHYYICGPGGMRIKLLKNLKKRGVPFRNLHSENFSV